MDTESIKFKKSFYNQVMKQSSIDCDDLQLILESNKKELIIDFLLNFPHFTQDNLLLIEKFINDNLNNRNRLFVSDLIEAAIDFNLDLDYTTCLSFLSKYTKDHHYVLIAVIEYICSNLKMSYLKMIIADFEKIIASKDADDVAKIFALFYAYRITFKSHYLIELEKYVMDNDTCILLTNLLAKAGNQEDFFEGNIAVKQMIERRSL